MAAAPDPQLSIARFTAAVLGLQLGRGAMADAVQVVAAQGLQSAADLALASAFQGLGADQRAWRVVNHLGLEPRNVEPAQQLLQQLFEQAGPQAGRRLLDVLQALADTSSVTDFYTDGLRFNRRIDDALARVDRFADNVPFHVERQVALTAADDTVFGNAVDDISVTGTRLAVATTWNPGDRLPVDGLSLVRLALTADGSAGPLVLPSLSSVEQLTIESRATPGSPVLRVDSTAVPDLQLLRLQASQVDVTVQAPVGGSPALRHLQLQLVDTAAGGIDHGVHFQGLAGEPVDAAAIRLELMDTRAATSADPADRARPLKDSPYNGISFHLNGQRVVLKDDLPQDAARTSFNGAQTHDELLHAVQLLLTRADNLARWPALAQVTAALGPGFDAVDTRSGQLATGTGIVLSVPAASGLVLKPGNFVADDGTTGEGLHTVMTAEGFRRTELPAAHVVLDHAGQGLAGGDLVIGGSAADGSPYAPGITRFEITVERDSALGVVAAADGRLQEVVVRNGAADGGLKVQGWDQVTSLVGGAAADGDTAGLPGIGAAHGAWGFTDVRLLDLSGLRGPASVDAVLTASAHQRYANQEVSYLLGSGNDHLALVVQGASASMRLRVAGGPGNDHIELATGAHSVELAFGPGFGDDRIVGFDSGDRLDFGALGGTTAGRVLTKVPALQSLPVVDGQVDRVEVGAAVVDAASVAARYIDGAGAVDRAQVVVTSQGAQAQVWQVVDPAGAGNLSVTLAGSLTLDSADWMLLMPGNFG